MRQTPEAVQQNLAERLCGQAAYRDDSRVARRLVAQASRHRRHRAPPHPDPGPGALGVCAGRGVRCRGGGVPACHPKSLQTHGMRWKLPGFLNVLAWRMARLNGTFRPFWASRGLAIPTSG